MVENNSKGLHIILGGALVLIALFVVIAIVSVRSQADSSGTRITELAITNAAPSVSSVLIQSTTAGLASTVATPGSQAANLATNDGDVYTWAVTATITDDNGFGVITPNGSYLDGAFTGSLPDSDANSVLVTLWEDDGATMSAGCTADANNCYQAELNTTSVGACHVLDQSADTTQIRIYCPFDLAYRADSTATEDGSRFPLRNWIATVQAKDNAVGATYQANTSSTIEMATTLSLQFGAENIVYSSSLAAGASSSDTTNTPLTFTQKGNTKADILVYGTAAAGSGAMTCDGGTTIPLANQTVAPTDIGWAGVGALAIGATLGTAANPDINVGFNTSATDETSTAYFNIDVPVGVKGSCTGSLTIASVASTN